MMGAGTVGDAKNLVDASAALQAALGVDETGTFRNIVSKGFGASAGAPATVDQLLQASAVAGSSAAALGVTDEQLLAGIATIAKVEGPETAGVQMKQFLAGVEKKAIPQGIIGKGDSLVEMITKLQQLVGDGGNIRSMIGDNVRSVAGFRTLSANMEKFNENLGNVNASTVSNQFGEDAFARKVSFAEQVIPELIATKAEQVGKARQELGGTKVATDTALANALQSDMLTEARKTGWFGELGVAFQKMWFGGERAVFGDRAFVKDWESGGSDETRQAIRDAAMQLKEAAGDLRDATSNVANQRAAVAGAPE